MGSNGCCDMPPSCGTKETKKEGSCGTTAMTGACSTEKKCCYGTLLRGALFGGLVMFVVYWVSWGLLPFHKESMSSFKNEAAVAKVLTDNAATSGIYVLPTPPDMSAPLSKNAITKPFAYASIKVEGVGGKEEMNKQIGKQLALCLLLAVLLTCLLKCKSCCGCPVVFSAKVGLFAGLVATIPGVIWFHFPLSSVIFCLIDTVIAASLAGLVISKFVLKSSGACGAKKGDCGTKTGSCG